MSLNPNTDTVKAHLENAARRTISLTLTDNSSSMLSFRRRGKSLSVRLHRIFLDAGCDVLDEIASYLVKRGVRTPLFREYVRQNMERIKQGALKRVFVRTKGKCHDLAEVFSSVNDEYFGGGISCRITWGVNGARHTVRKRTLGSYSRHTHTIRINPFLDKKSVPRYYVEFVVYHEMLHADMEISGVGRRRVHSTEFKKRERMFKQYHRAMAWERKN